ncbi:MAG TPA: hypothetical protein VLE19_12025 [Pyrinomonadaceae bacterium]|nr:hypothetical protein [Pyrinomonadaceae bacterium]
MRLVRSTFIGCVLLIAGAPLTFTQAQAWLPLRGEGQVTTTYENIYVRDHYDYTGKRFDAGPIRTNTVITDLEYGITNKLTFDSEITHVTSKYEGFVGPVPHGPPDTGFYHPTFQDARVGIRYNVLSRQLVVTPFIAIVIPTHHYETRGHTAVGRDVHELQVGVNVGRDLEDIIPHSYVEGRYSYAISEKVEQLNLNRSNADWEFGYFVGPKLSLRFTGAWQHSYGGIRIPLDNGLPDYHELHDRAAKSGFVRFGGGLSVSLTRSIDLHADFGNTARGTNTHAARGLSLGISWRFSRGGFRVGKF